MPNITYLTIFMGVVSFLLSACQKEESKSPIVSLTVTTAPQLEGRLNIVAPAKTIEAGDNEVDVDWVSEFEQATQCQVNITVTHSADETVRRVNEGEYDAVLASGDVSLRLIASGKVKPIDIKRIHSYPTIDPRLRNALWHTVEGVHYGVPYQWQPNGLIYDARAFKMTPTRWSILFEEQPLADGKSNKGRIQASGSPLYIADAALYLMASRPELGIKNPYELDETQYATVFDVLRGQKNLLSTYWRDAALQRAEFLKSSRGKTSDGKTSEGIVASVGTLAQIHALRAEQVSLPVAWSIPEEGVTGRADTTLMSTDAKHPNCTYAWMEWSLLPKVQAKTAAWLNTVPVVPSACAHSPLSEEICRAQGSDSFSKVWFWRLPKANCGKSVSCVPYSRWVQDYFRLMED